MSIDSARIAGVLAMLAALLVFMPACVHYRGYAAADGRAHFFPPQLPGQSANHGISLMTEPEFHVRSKDKDHTATVRPFLRLDPNDRQRTHGDLRQADYRLHRGPWSFGVGAGLFTWGVLENHRQVDVVNQTDLVEDIDGSEKLGQPYTGVGFAGRGWQLQWLYLPFFRDRTFPGRRGRPRLPAIVDADAARFESTLGRWHPNVAGRLGVQAGEFDIGLTAFSGLSRDPRFLVQVSAPDEVVPAYDLMEQLGADVQWTHGALVAKVEGAARWWGRDFRFGVGAGAGLEYWLFDLGGKGVDLTLLAEYYYDSRAADLPLTFHQNDVFGGLRLALSDAGSTQFLAGGMVDVISAQSYLAFEASRRFGEHWRLFFEVRSFLGRSGRLESSIVRSDYAQLRVAYYF